MSAKWIAAPVVALVLLWGVGAEAQESPLEVEGATTVDAAAAKALFDRGAKFVDVRGDRLWKIAHIPGATSLDAITKLSEEDLLKVATKDDEVVFYCSGFG